MELSVKLPGQRNDAAILDRRRGARAVALVIGSYAGAAVTGIIWIPGFIPDWRGPNNGSGDRVHCDAVIEQMAAAAVVSRDQYESPSLTDCKRTETVRERHVRPDDRRAGGRPVRRDEIGRNTVRGGAAVLRPVRGQRNRVAEQEQPKKRFFPSMANFGCKGVCHRNQKNIARPFCGGKEEAMCAGSSMNDWSPGYGQISYLFSGVRPS